MSRGIAYALLPRLGYLILSGLVPVRTFAARTELWFDLAVRIAGNPLVLASPTPETPNSDFHLWHERTVACKYIIRK